MIDVYGARKLSPEADAALLKQFRENWTPRKKRRDPIGYQNALSDLRAERFKLPSRMADVLGIHRATYRSDEPISWLDAQRLNLEVMRSKLPGVTHRAGSDVTWNTEAPVVRLTGDQPQKLQSWLETNTTADYRPNRQAVNHAVSAQSDADRIFRQLEYLAADSTDPAVRQARIEHLRQHISYLDSVDPGLRNPRSGFKRDLELSRANARLDDIMAPDAQETIAGLRAQHDQAAVKATEARNALARTIAPDGTDLLSEYSPPSVRRYHQNAQPKALNWVVRNNPETGSIEVLMLRRGYGSEKGLNTPPGGIQDARMTGRETAVEEALEEAGLYTNPVFELTTPIGYNQTSVVSVVDFGAPVKVQRSEVQGYSWMPLDEVTPSNVAYPEYAMPQIRQLQQWAKTQTPDQFAAAATASGNSPRPRPDFSSDKPPDDGFGTVDVGDYGEELAEYGYRETADGLLVPVPVGQPIGALQGYPTELQRSHPDADSQKNTESLFDDNGDGPGASLRPLDRDSAPSRTILAGGEHGGLKGTLYPPPTTPGDAPYAPPTTPGDAPYAPPTTPGDTPYAPPTTPGDTPYAPPTTPGDTPYAPPTTPGDTPYAPPTTPGDTPYAPPTTPGDTPYAPPTTPGDAPYAPPTTPGDTPYAPPTTPGDTPYAPRLIPQYVRATLDFPGPRDPTGRTNRRDPDGPDDDVSRRVIPDPVDVEPGLNPREITHYDVTKTTTDLVTGEQTITPVEHVSIGTAEITSYSPEDPAGNVHRSGPLIIEATEDQVLLESATRRRDARLRDPGAAEIHPHDVSDADRQVVEAALAETRSASVGKRPQIREPAQFTPPTAEQRARMNERFQAQSANVGERPRIRQRSEFTAPTAEQRAKMRERFENQSRSARSGGGSRPTVKQRSGQGLSEESKAERRKVALRPGQGLAKKPDPYAGLTGGGGAARRGGGGRRRRDDEEEERRRRGGTPQITLVVRG